MHSLFAAVVFYFALAGLVLSSPTRDYPSDLKLVQVQGVFHLPLSPLNEYQSETYFGPLLHPLLQSLTILSSVVHRHGDRTPISSTPSFLFIIFSIQSS
jgi:hypothetical protein